METFETVSFHIVKPCNMKCKFCYATFEDMHVQQMSVYDAKHCIRKLFLAGVKKITFAGGEPMLYKHLDECIIYAKSFGMTTSIITNGSLITDEWLWNMRKQLDWVGLSIDSIVPETNIKIGRQAKYPVHYFTLIDMIKQYGFKLKINTVVNAYNKHEDMNEFISKFNPSRWKVFQALRVDGQNDKQFDEIKVSDREFKKFIKRHSLQSSLVPEDNEAMTGSYLLVDPQGRLFENSSGKHTYSDSLIDNSFEDCAKQINLDRDMFIKRGGIYNW